MAVTSFTLMNHDCACESGPGNHALTIDFTDLLYCNLGIVDAIPASYALTTCILPPACQSYSLEILASSIDVCTVLGSYLSM